MRRLLAALLAALLFALAAAPALAGTSCEIRPVAPHAFLQSLDLAEAAVQKLDASGADVALIARVGQDLSRYGLRYSHMAWVVRDHPKGRWIVVHELNDCGSARSDLYDQGLLNFFLDDLYAYDAAVLLPSPRLRQRARLLLAGGMPRQLHQPRYNMLSYAFGTTYQNSNQWVLEMWAAAASDLAVTDRSQAQAWLKLTGYAPGRVQIPAATRLGARMFKANISFDDHPFGERMAGRIDTVTVESVLAFMRRTDPEAVLLEFSSGSRDGSW